MRVRKIICIYSTLAFALAGCAQTEIPTAQGNTQYIAEIKSALYSDEHVTLYFRCRNEPYLAGEPRIIAAQSDERKEVTVLKALIAGPSTGSPEMGQIIHPSTKVLGVENNGDILYVTLSSEFFLQPKPLPQDWAQDILQREEAQVRRRLAIYSIVNTLAGMGRYGRIQILVDANGSGQGSRPDVYWEGETEAEAKPIEALSFDSSYVLTAEKAANIVLSAITERNWQELYDYLSLLDSNNVRRPVFEVASAQMQQYYMLYEYQIVDVVHSLDSSSAVIFADILISQNGDTRYESVPFKFINEGGVWKIGFNLLNERFISGGERQ